MNRQNKGRMDELNEKEERKTDMGTMDEGKKGRMEGY